MSNQQRVYIEELWAKAEKLNQMEPAKSKLDKKNRDLFIRECNILLENHICSSNILIIEEFSDLNKASRKKVRVTAEAESGDPQSEQSTVIKSTKKKSTSKKKVAAVKKPTSVKKEEVKKKKPAAKKVEFQSPTSSKKKSTAKKAK